MSEKSNSSFLICGAVAALAGAAGVAIGYQLRKSLKVKASDVKGNDPGMLSSRGTRATIPAISYLPSFMECLHNLYDAKQAKDGYICLAVAENKLGSSRLLVKKWQEVVSTFTEDELAGFQCCEFYFCLSAMLFSLLHSRSSSSSSSGSTGCGVGGTCRCGVTITLLLLRPPPRARKLVTAHIPNPKLRIHTQTPTLVVAHSLSLR